MGFLSRFLPKRKQPEIKNNIPKEKKNIKNTFAVFCHKNHNTPEGQLCTKCSALLAQIMTKMNRCPYGITKPICDRCDRICFGTKQSGEFLHIMQSSQTGMFFKHPIMTLKHKLAGMGVDYVKYQRQKKADDKVKAKEKAAQEKEKRKDKQKNKDKQKAKKNK